MKLPAFRVYHFLLVIPVFFFFSWLESQGEHVGRGVFPIAYGLPSEGGYGDQVRVFLIADAILAEGGYAEDQVRVGDWFCQRPDAANKEEEYREERLGNVKEAVKWYRKAADQGYAKAQIKLWEIYKEGVFVDLPEGIPEDHKEAMKWLRKAAEQGNHRAQLYLAVSFDPIRTVGQDKDEEEALMWYRKAADQGNVGALEAVGYIYSDPRYQEMRDAVGIPEPDSMGRGFKNYLTAYAYFSLSVFCDDNPGRQFGADDRNQVVLKMSIKQLNEAPHAYQDLLKQFKEKKQKALLAEKEFSAAEEKALIENAEAGDASAQKSLAWRIYSEWVENWNSGYPLGERERVEAGGFMVWDVEEALKWWRKAADQGDAEAQYILGVINDDPRDGETPTAHAWYTLSSFHGKGESDHNQGPISRRDQMAKGMTPRKLEEAQEIYEELLKQIEENKKKAK
ncbi:MAG TPA: sel1 repeat family protein [Planctomycetes bacterium]|nr:sel1 repeat family protein [Planctomycetota bacterium]HIL36529.1 sel1 repeat family protein [Planctomycetota bacterium]